MSDTDTTQVSDDEVLESRERVNQLREELAAVNAELVSNEESRNNAVRKDRLDREADSLERQLQAARERLAASRGEGTSDGAPAASANKDEWVEYAASRGIPTEGKTKEEIQDDVAEHARTGFVPTAPDNEAHVNSETGEVNPEEVERLTSFDASDPDED